MHIAPFVVRRLAFAWIVAACCGLGSLEASAQAPFPTHPIQVIVPATAGGPVDTGIRVIEPQLSAILGSPLVLINRPGASGIVGMNAVATSEPNGYNIGAGINSAWTIVHMSGSSVPYSIDDFVSLGNYATGISVFAVHPDSPIKTFEELVAFARSNPGKLTYGTAGIGTVSSLAVQALKAAFGLDLLEIPFPGGAQQTTALLGRHIDLAVVPYSTAIANLQDNKLRPLVTTASQRLAKLPTVPTLTEKGVPNRALNLVLGLYAPKGIPDAARSALTSAVERAAKDPSIVDKFEKIGLLAEYENPTAARERLQTEYKSVMELAAKTSPAK